MEITIQLLGALLFVGIHLVPTRTGLRERLVNRLSLNGYKGLFALLSFAGLGLLIWGQIKAPHTDVWIPAPWANTVALYAMLPAIVLLAAAKFPTNIKRITPHPMMWGFMLWSGAHLLANGDLASIILFGTLGLYSLVALLSANQRGATVSTLVVPLKNEALVIGFGVIVYVALAYLHPVLFGIAVR